MDDAFTEKDGKISITKSDELKPFVELSDDKWKEFKGLEITGMSDGQTKYTLKYDKFEEIKNKKYQPTGKKVKEATLEQILQALDGKGNETTTGNQGK